MDESYAQTRSDRIRAAMFPHLCGDNLGDRGAPLSHRSGIVTNLSEPSQLLTTAVVELLSLQDETELTTKAIPELVKLLSDKDEVSVIFSSYVAFFFLKKTFVNQRLIWFSVLFSSL